MEEAPENFKQLSSVKTKRKNISKFIQLHYLLPITFITLTTNIICKKINLEINI